MGLVRKAPELFPSQKESVEFEMERDRVLDFSEPGTGKTRSRLEVFSRRRSKGAKAMLVIAPKSLLRSAWEIDARRYTPWLKVSVAFATNRVKAFEAKADIYVTNHDAAKWLAAQKPDFFKKFDYLVVDEGDAFKHSTSQRSRAMNKIKKYFKFRCLMNGAPNTNTILDVWNQAFIVDDGKRLGTSYFAFRSAVATPEQVGPKPEMVKWVDREGAEQQVADLLKDITIRHKLTDVPANRNYVVPFYLKPQQLANYLQMERDAVLQLKSGEISAVNAAAVVTKLLQIASGAVYDGEENYHLINTERYEMVMDMVEARKHTLVFFLWKHQRDQLIAEADKRGLTHMLIDGSVRSDEQRNENVQMFQAGMYRVGFLHPKSAAHGLTLTKATATIWASPTYDLGWWVQGKHRIDRRGQTQETENINVIAQGTLEEKVYERMMVKGGKVKSLLEFFE